MAGVSSIDVTSGEGPLINPLLGPADSGTGGVRRGARGLGTSGGRRAVGVRGNAGGGNRRGRRSRRRVWRASVGEADNLGTSNNESIKGIDPDVGPLESVVHSGEAGELAGGWLVGASVLHVDLTVKEISLSHRNTNRIQKEHIHAAWVVLGLSGAVKCNDLIANQLCMARKKRHFCQVEARIQRD